MLNAIHTKKTSNNIIHHQQEVLVSPARQVQILNLVCLFHSFLKANRVDIGESPFLLA